MSIVGMSKSLQAAAREPIIAAIESRIFSGEPFTFHELHRGADNAYREAVRLIQKHRKKGFISFVRFGRDTMWSLTDAGKEEKARRDESARATA